jgi:hypothetical protein
MDLEGCGCFPIPFAMVHGSEDEPDVEPSQIYTHFSWQEIMPKRVA